MKLQRMQEIADRIDRQQAPFRRMADQMAKARTGNKGMHQDVPLEPILVNKASRVPEDT